MKKLFIILIAAAFVQVSFAQNNVISKHFASYLQEEGVTKVSVTGKMFSLFTEIDADDPDEKEVLEAMSKLKGIKAVIKKNPTNGKELYKSALKKLDADGSYEELMTVENDTENIRFMINDQNGVINELTMVLAGGEQFMVMTLFGEIDLNQIARIARVLKIKGMEEFGAIGEKSN